MTKSVLKKILKERQIFLSKNRGQNFLIDQNILQKMIKNMNLQENETILEVGPGCGALTKELLTNSCKVTAIEIDQKLYLYLKETFVNENLNLIWQDACKVNYEQLLQEKNFRCIANLPYNISSIFISKMLQLTTKPHEMFFLLQKEMAERLAAKPNTKQYNALSVFCQIFYTVKQVLTIPKEVFFPQPTISSSFVKLTRTNLNISQEEQKMLKKITHIAFLHRRKKLFKNLKSVFKEQQIILIQQELNLNENTRAEDLSKEQYIQMTKLAIKFK